MSSSELITPSSFEVLNFITPYSSKEENSFTLVLTYGTWHWSPAQYKRLKCLSRFNQMQNSQKSLARFFRSKFVQSQGSYSDFTECLCLSRTYGADTKQVPESSPFLYFESKKKCKNLLDSWFRYPLMLNEMNSLNHWGERASYQLPLTESHASADIHTIYAYC